MVLWTRTRGLLGVKRSLIYFALFAVIFLILIYFSMYIKLVQTASFPPERISAFVPAVFPNTFWTENRGRRTHDVKIKSAIVDNMTKMTMPAISENTTVMSVFEKLRTFAQKTTRSRSLKRGFIFWKKVFDRTESRSAQRGRLENASEQTDTTTVNLGKLESECASIAGSRMITFRPQNRDLIYFRPALTGPNRSMLLETMDAFTAALDQINVSYYMYGGTLMGSWRHHGIIPWDDDIDFAVPRDQSQRVYRVLMDLKPRFILDVRQKVRWKLFQKDAHPIKSVSWKYPFLDINFYDENSTFVWDHDVAIFGKYKYPKEWVFPLKLRPFCGRMLWSPHQPETTLRLNYNLEQCFSGNYNHKEERLIYKTQQRTVECRKLYDLLPFVKRTSVKEGCNETLELNGLVLSYFLDSSGC